MPKSKKSNENLQNQINELKKQVEENLAGWQKAQADLENLQKRTLIEKEEYRKFCLEDLILQILPVLDNFKLATDHAPEDQKDSSWLVGIMHIQKQLSDVVANYGAVSIEINCGDEFDPNLADAIESAESDVQTGHIVRIVQTGYRLNGKVLRHAKVVVAR